MKVTDYSITPADNGAIQLTARIEGVDEKTRGVLIGLGTILKQATADGKITTAEEIEIALAVITIFNPQAQAQFGPLVMVVEQALADGKIEFIEWLIISGTLKSALSFRPAAAKTA